MNDFYERDTHLNSREIEEARNFLTFLAKGSEPYCGLNADLMKGCGKNITVLKNEWISIRNSKNKSIERKRPYLVINEKHGFGLHRYVGNGKLEYCGNVNYYCYSCNKFEIRRESNIQVEATGSYSNKKSRKVRPKFKEELLNHLTNSGDICEEACVNKWSDTEMFDCAQKLLKECITQLMDSKILRVKKSEWGFDCQYSLCSDYHLIHIKKEHQPIPKETDEEFVERELKSNEK